nr:unnamed protein product [Callosobruchus analis]
MLILTLRFLATGDSYGGFQCPFKIPDVCQAIIDSLNVYFYY